jgi:hypothetical protein
MAERSTMKTFFDEFKPYLAQMNSGHFTYAIDGGLEFLREFKRSYPKQYDDSPKGTPLYFMAIAAFLSRDYQTATFLFDAAVSEDLKHHQGKPDQPALLFMQLDNRKQAQAAIGIVNIAVRKLEEMIHDYNEREGSKYLTLPNVRDNFLKHCIECQEKYLRTVATTFVSFLLEWDYRLQMIDLSTAASHEPFFMHLFKGCLLFESLLKMNPKQTVHKRDTLGELLGDACLLKRLHIEKINNSSHTLDQIAGSVVPRQCVQAAADCTLQTRNRLAHNLGLAVPSLDQQRYELMGKNIFSSCLHAISLLYG